MSEHDLDDMLRRYLLREEASPIHETVRKLVDEVNRQELRNVERHEKLLRVTDAHHYRLTTLEAKQAELAQDVEDTGKHDLDELTRKVRRTDSTLYKAAVVVLAGLDGAGIVASVQALASGRAVPSPAVDSRPGSK